MIGIKHSTTNLRKNNRKKERSNPPPAREAETQPLSLLISGLMLLNGHRAIIGHAPKVDLKVGSKVGHKSI